MSPVAIAALVLLVAVALAALAAVRRARADARAARDEARRAVDAAHAAGQRSRTALEELPEIAIRVDAQGRLIEANRAARERFVFLEAGMTVLTAFSEHELAGRIATALERMEPARLQVRLFAGGRRTYRAVVAPYALPEGPEALVFLRDDTDAAEYQALRAGFVANVSHELRTPLTGLRGLLDALVDPDIDPETRERFTRRAAAETARLEALIADILFLSELESGHDAPPDAVSDLAEAVTAGAAALAPLAERHRVAVELDLAGPAPAPLTARMAETIARNLIENAIRYAGPGATARASVRAEGGTVVLAVADDGVGIAQRHLLHVFERFYRADPSRSTSLGGTGLGLSIVKHIAERSGGEATATSREGFGTTVTVTLPLPSAARDPKGSAEAPGRV
jgi:two-component system phosphate regulon sensor histidine kinase PhoR